MMRGRCARANTLSARSTDSGAGICRGTASTTRTSDRTPDADADVLRPIYPVRGFRIRLGRVHLVELLIVALLEVDDCPVARSANLNHRKAVGGGVGQRHHAVEKTGSRDG